MKRCMLRFSYCNSNFNGKKLEGNFIFIKRGLVKKIMVYLYNGI